MFVVYQYNSEFYLRWDSLSMWKKSTHVGNCSFGNISLQPPISLPLYFCHEVNKLRILFFSCMICLLLNVFIYCFILFYFLLVILKNKRLNAFTSSFNLLLFFIRAYWLCYIHNKNRCFSFLMMSVTITCCVIWKRHKINHLANFDLYYFDH